MVLHLAYLDVPDYVVLLLACLDVVVGAGLCGVTFGMPRCPGSCTTMSCYIRHTYT